MLPTLFISHGSPMLALQPGVYGRAWQEMVATLSRPDAILVVSAHWTTAHPALALAERPGTIHDFGSFPPELYGLRYPAPGAPALARSAAALLVEAGIEAGFDSARGLDHGTWVPLLHMYPEANIPVTQLSVQPGRDAAWHFRLGRALQPLRAQNVLLLASGSLTHNLRDFDSSAFAADRAEPYVKAFQEWMFQALATGDSAGLADWERQAPAALRAHPSPEHLLPLFVACGAGGASPQVRRALASYSGGALAMDCYVFD